MTTTNETLPSANPAGQESAHHIYMPAELLTLSLGGMATAEAQQTRRRLSAAAQEAHGAALAYTLETNRAADIPSAALWPGIVGQETVATLALARRQAGRRLVRHPTDSSKHLIVPL